MCLGVPAQIVAIEDAGRFLASAEIGGVRRSINVVCVVTEQLPLSALPGRWVVLHAGFAMSLIDEAQAAETLRLIGQMTAGQAGPQ